MFLPRSRLVDLRDRMLGSFWFVPSIMFLGALALAVITLRIDIFLERSDALSTSPWFPKFAADASRSILSTLASGMLTVTGVVFSLTIVALQLGSSQFGPRLLRTFMNSRGTQVVLGTFTSSFIYYLLAMGSVRADIGFVPQISTATGIFLGVVDIAVLIYFVHHLASSIRIESLLATVKDDLREVIDSLYPSNIGEERGQRPETDWKDVAAGSDGSRVRAKAAGYIRQIDSKALMSTACEHDLLLRVELQPGAFVLEGGVLLTVWPDRAVSGDTEENLRKSVVLGRDRTPVQDVGFAIRQLVEVALRALSPGINDPYTAVECTNRLAEALCVAARRRRPQAERRDETGRVRVIAEPMSLPAMARTAFAPIARAGGGNGDVAVRVLESLVTIAACARNADDRRVLIDFACELADQVQAQLTLERDRRAVGERFHSAMQALGHRSPDGTEGSDRKDLPLALQGDAI